MNHLLVRLLTPLAKQPWFAPVVFVTCGASWTTRKLSPPESTLFHVADALYGLSCSLAAVSSLGATILGPGEHIPGEPNLPTPLQRK